MSYPEHLFEGGVLPLCRGTVGVFYSPRNEDEDNSSNSLSDKNYQASSQKFRKTDETICLFIHKIRKINLVSYPARAEGKNGGARGVMVIVVGKEHSDTSSNPGQNWLHFT